MTVSRAGATTSPSATRLEDSADGEKTPLATKAVTATGKTMRDKRLTTYKDTELFASASFSGLPMSMSCKSGATTPRMVPAAHSAR